MKNKLPAKDKSKREDPLLPEYRFDYTKSKHNRIAGRVKPGSVAILPDPDVDNVSTFQVEWAFA